MQKHDWSTVLICISVVAVLCTAPVFALTNTVPKDIECTVGGPGSWGGYELPLTDRDFASHGFQSDDYVVIHCDDTTFRAIYTDSPNCCFPYEIGISRTGSSDNVQIFTFNSNLASLIPEIRTGCDIRISFESHTDRRGMLPSVSSGMIATPAAGQSPEDFANFRCIDLNGFRIWRSTSPLYMYAGTLKPSVCDRCFASDDISYVINITDSPEGIASKIDGQRGTGICDHYISLYDDDSIFCHRCDADTITYAHLLKEPLLKVIEHKGDNICLHCSHGKDRTGFVFMLLECVAGWSFDDISKDYTDAFANIYGFAKGSDEYGVVKENYFGRMYYMMAHPSVINDIGHVDWDDVNLSKIDPYASAKRFLLENVGLTQEEFDQLKALVS